MTADLDELAGELADFAPPEKKVQRSAKEERVIAGFEDIQRFAQQHGRAPLHGEERDIFERLYAVRLDRLRALTEYHELLMPMDHQGLLSTDQPAKPAPADRLRWRAGRQRSSSRSPRVRSCAVYFRLRRFAI